MDTTSRALRRTAAGTATALALVLLAACGSSDGTEASGSEGGKEKGGASTPAASAPAEAKGEVLSAAALEKAAVADGDVPGHRIDKRAEVDHTEESEVETSRDACGPLALAALGTTTGGPAATAERQALSQPAGKDVKDLESAFDTTKSMITVASYEANGAPSAMAALRKGVDSCKGGFTTRAHGEEMKIVSVAADKAPALGEEATAFTVVSQEGHDKASFKVVVVRKGRTLAYFSALNLGAIVSGKGFAFPVPLAKAQAGKLP
ncbi:hypothetical protein [Streptomyces physcomitrii]|uniref:Lipoprotein n=1 Tax=Streptomyces physcomitrii TaxID=2724184 RepID=A0ABX1H9Q2_9ACTN|nr:hypothetical protein [Streptomyces physcomitrii]NKI44828.1 hypothetical protein [Streptomyces physcomitrii]